MTWQTHVLIRLRVALIAGALGADMYARLLHAVMTEGYGR